MPDDGRRATGCLEASSGALAPRIGDRRSFFHPLAEAEETTGRDEEEVGRKRRGDFPGGEEEEAPAGEERL